MDKSKDTVIGVCVRCGKKHDVPVEVLEDIESDWRFKCSICGAYRIFINEDITTEIILKDKSKGETEDKIIHRCGTCGEVLRRGGEGDAIGHGLDIYQCTNEYCKRMYYALWY